MNTRRVAKHSPFDILRRTIFDNPMLDESMRAQRKFFPKGRIGVRAGFVLFWMFYIWIAVEAYLSMTDLTEIYSYFELTLITLILPSSIYNAISGERERGTWDALVLTKLTPGQIVFGKLIWRLRIILTIWVLAMIPICMSRITRDSFDITNGMVVLSQLVILLWGISLATFGLWISSITRKSITSLAVIALTLIGGLILLPLLYSLFYSILGGQQDRANHDLVFITITQFDPFVCVYTVLSPSSQDEFTRLLGPPGIWQCCVYAFFTVVFTAFSHQRLKQLERPIRGAM
jgi:ABC-type transport system involved in multi-copper enzyme maturation permease subunit